MKELIASILFLLPIGAGASIPAFPMAFYGAVSVNGIGAPVGTVVRAYYGTTLAGQVAVKETGIYGYSSLTKQQLLVGEGAGRIRFTFQVASINGGQEMEGAVAQSHASFIAGRVEQKDLAFTYTAPVIVQSPSSGGGGGGIPAITPKKLFGDANGDGKVNKYDFALLMANWGKTVSNMSDLNGDGKVNKYDFALLMANWTK